MPNYHYRCKRCEALYEMTLPMSHDPKLLYECQEEECGGLCRRVIISAPQFKGFKVFADKWFKDTYGFELGEKAITRKKFREDLEKARRLSEKDGVSINHEHIKKLEGD